MLHNPYLKHALAYLTSCNSVYTIILPNPRCVNRYQSVFTFLGESTIIAKLVIHAQACLFMGTRDRWLSTAELVRQSAERDTWKSFAVAMNRLECISITLANVFFFSWETVESHLRCPVFSTILWGFRHFIDLILHILDIYDIYFRHLWHLS